MYISKPKLSQEQQDQIKKKLIDKIKNLKCPMCNENNFIMIEGYFTNSYSADYKQTLIGGDVIPTIPIVCKNCGFVSQHALGILGFLNDKEKQDDR